MLKQIKHFLHMDASSGILLVIAALLAMVVANTPLFEVYDNVLHTYIAGLSIAHWINDGLMAIFFLLVGLEVKRELKVGALRTKETAIFPAIAAVGGMLIPALIYLIFNYGDPETQKGWAIPAATDIAFALGVLSLLGTRVPVALKVFLLALAIIDDLGVIIIIALFYTAKLNVIALLAAAACVAVLVVMNLRGVLQKRWYLLVGAVLWFFVYKSGIHATLAGVIVGFCLPLVKDKEHGCPLKDLEHALHPYVSFLILPIFAFANAAIPLAGVSLATLTSAVPMGASLGLFLGKPIGVFIFSWVAVKVGMAKLPSGVDFKQIFGVAVLCGIGFTMSIFISLLAFGSGDAFNYSRLGILIGSTFAGIVGYAILFLALPSANDRLSILEAEADALELEKQQQ